MPTGQSSGTPHPSRFIVALSLLAALQTAPPVWAWGRLGHRLSARIAERNLNPQGESRRQGVARGGGVDGRCLDLGR
jgi:hypothetical protein